MPEPPRFPYPTGQHHQHSGLDCDEQWRADILAAINRKDQQ